MMILPIETYWPFSDRSGSSYRMRQPIFSTSSGLTRGTLKHSLNRGESTCWTFVLYLRLDGNISIRTLKPLFFLKKILLTWMIGGTPRSWFGKSVHSRIVTVIRLFVSAYSRPTSMLPQFEINVDLFFSSSFPSSLASAEVSVSVGTVACSASSFSLIQVLYRHFSQKKSCFSKKNCPLVHSPRPGLLLCVIGRLIVGIGVRNIFIEPFSHCFFYQRNKNMLFFVRFWAFSVAIKNLSFVRKTHAMLSVLPIFCDILDIKN